MIREAIDRILGLSAPTVIEFDGKRYMTAGKMSPVETVYPESLLLNNLTGIVDYVKSSI